MAYINPEDVVAPKSSWKLKKVIHNTKQGGWSAAEGSWDEREVLALRWNGSDSETGVGNPQSRGHATWFVVPDELESGLRKVIEQLADSQIADCVIHKPDDYDVGAWRAEITLTPIAKEHFKNWPLTFILPSLAYRICYSDKGYVKAVGGELRGAFVDGKWEGDVYSNGIPECDNPTSIDAVKDSFVQNINRAAQLAGFKG